MKIFAVLFALLLSSAAARAADLTAQWWQTIALPAQPVPIVKIGANEITFRSVLPQKKNDAPRGGFFVGDSLATKTAIYPGRRYHVAIVTRDGKTQWFINGFPDGAPSGPVLNGTVEDPNRKIHTAERALSDEEIRAGYKSGFRAEPVITIGHRGDNRHMPENTNISYVTAIEKHTPIVEMDLRLTKDNVLVLLHDPTVDRTTKGKGPIVEMNLADAQKLDAGSWKDPKFAGEKIPRVADICATCRNRAIMMLDLKCTGLGPSLSALQKELNFPGDQWILAPWEDEEGTALRKYLPNVTMIRLTSKIPTDKFDEAYFSRMKQIGFSAFSVNWQYLTQAFIDAAHKNDMKIYTWTVNDPPEVSGAVLAQVDGIITDDPAATMKLIDRITSK